MIVMARTTNRAVFNASLLPEAEPRWDLFSAGFGLQIAAVTALVVIPLLLPQKLDIVAAILDDADRSASDCSLEAATGAASPKPVPVKNEVVKEMPKPKPVPVVEPPKPQIYAPVVARADRQETGGAQEQLRAGYDGGGEGLPGPDSADVHGQLGDSHFEEASRSRADRRIRRSRTACRQTARRTRQRTSMFKARTTCPRAWHRQRHRRREGRQRRNRQHRIW